jgi:hypothetical protein
MTITQQATRLYEMAHEKECADSCVLDIEAVFRFLGGPVSGTWYVTAGMVVHFAHTLPRDKAIHEIGVALVRAQGADYADIGARA